MTVCTPWRATPTLILPRTVLQTFYNEMVNPQDFDADAGPSKEPADDGGGRA